jgi:hypothetical protein
MERSVYLAGRGGNMVAARLWLFCQARHRGWADTRQLHVTAQSRAEVLVSVAEGVRTALNAGIAAHGTDAVLALQEAYLTIEEGDSEELTVGAVDAD